MNTAESLISEKGRRLGNEGGIPLRILFLLITLIIVGISIALLLREKQKRHEINYNKALIISEYGLQQALEDLRDSPSLIGKKERTDYNEGWYTVAMDTHTVNDTVLLNVESSGHCGSVYREKEITLKLVVNGSDSLWIPQGIE